jgi:hypothetical protein
MQFYGFDFRDPIFNVDGWKLSFQVITLENTYGLDPNEITIDNKDGDWRLECDGLSWAGQQQRAEGSLAVTACRNDQGQWQLDISSMAMQPIRCVKVLVRGLNPCTIYDYTARDEVPLDKKGSVYYYPYNAYQYMNNLKSPVFFVNEASKGLLGFSCLDHKVRAKRFAAYEEKMGELQGTYTVELIHEESATQFSTSIDVPTWVLGMDENPDEFHNQYLQFAESDAGLGLVPWEKRTDFPDWMRGVSLSLTLHGMHWSGYVFNTYDQMREIIEYVTERIEGSRVLAYLPGWEGRYYWQYGEYRPEPLLGGEEGFAKLCIEAKKRGVHIMPMFGVNCANAWFDNFGPFGPSSYMKTASGNLYLGNTPDWDISRAHDTGWQAWLNPGAPAWQNELTRQIRALVDKYGFDGVFLDTVHHWVNDPDHDVYEGIKALKEKLQEGNPDLLVTAENWYDGMLRVFPLFQSRPFLKLPEWVGRYARTIAHLLEAEPSRGSTGVHELGYCPYQPKPLEKPYIPTLAFVDGTLDKSKPEIDRVIQIANEYAKKFC